MTPTDTSALLAKKEAELHALADIVLADFENSDGSNETVLQMCGRIIAGGFRRDPDLLDELDQLRGQVARVEAWHGWRRGTDAPDEALAAPAEGGEHVHLFESDGCITVGCPTQVCAACGHVENPHIEGCKAAEGGE